MRMPSDSDLAWVRRFRRAVAGRVDALTEVAGEELGREAFETLTSDIVPLLTACRWTERRSRRVLGPRRIGGGSIWQAGQRHQEIRVPLGRVGIIATWNYPIQLLGVQLVQALAAGNQVIVKPSERTPRTQALVLSLAREAGMSPERLAWTDATREAGAQLLDEGGLDHVVFTGSTGVGRVIAEKLAKTLTPSTLELSGCDSALVLEDANVELAARSIAYAVSLNRGRTCMAPRRAIVCKAVRERFQTALITALGTQSKPDMDSPAKSVDGGPDARVIEAGGVRVVCDADPGSPAARGDHFGPTIAILETLSDQTAIEMARANPQRLATSVFTRDTSRAGSLARLLGSSIVTINDSVIPTGHPGVSLGGDGASGWGETRGVGGLLAMTRRVSISKTPGRIRTPTDPPSEAIARRVRQFVGVWYGR